MFKKGDRVKCIDPDYGLVAGAIYTVIGVEGRYLSVKTGSVPSIYQVRFVKATKFKGNK